MQLIEQRFEFIVGDFIAARRRDAVSRHRRRRLGRKLAFAVQLIEQRLELGIGDLVAVASRDLTLQLFGSLGLGLHRIERVEQLFELAIGDVGLDRRLGFGDGWSLGRRRWGLGTGRLGQTRQCGQQLRRGRGNVAALAHLAKHAVDRIQCLEHHIHQFRIDPALTFAQDVEHVLGDMAALHQLIELKEAGAPFTV